jgi:tetratricopeptide (TPR) repeat protein
MSDAAQAVQPDRAPRNGPRGAAIAAAALFAAWGVAFSLSCRLPAEWTQPAAPPAGSASAAAAVVGSCRNAAAAYFFQQADAYFHRGVEHARETAFVNGFFRRLNSEIRPGEHQHLSGVGIREIMPWLKFAIETDPGNLDYPMVAAFWLTTEAGRPDIALDLLRLARIGNPNDCRLPCEQGRILIRLGRLDSARRLFDVSAHLHDRTPFESDENRRLSLREVFLHRALLAEAAGDQATALADLRAILAMYPNMNPIRERIRNIEQGTESGLSAAEMLKGLVEENARLREQCRRCDEEHDHASADHEDTRN